MPTHAADLFGVHEQKRLPHQNRHHQYQTEKAEQQHAERIFFCRHLFAGRNAHCLINSFFRRHTRSLHENGLPFIDPEKGKPEENRDPDEQREKHDVLYGGEDNTFDHSKSLR